MRIIIYRALLSLNVIKLLTEVGERASITLYTMDISR